MEADSGSTAWENLAIPIKLTVCIYGDPASSYPREHLYMCRETCTRMSINRMDNWHIRAMQHIAAKWPPLLDQHAWLSDTQPLLRKNILWFQTTLFEPKWSESVSHSVVSDSATPWTVAHQAPLSMRFPRQEYWSGLPFPSPGDLPNPGLLHCRQILYHLSYQGSP